MSNQDEINKNASQPSEDSNESNQNINRNNDDSQSSGANKEGSEGQEGQPAKKLPGKSQGEGEGQEKIDASSPQAARERMDIENHPDVASGEIQVDSEKDREFQEMHDKRVVLPRHESQDGVRNRENREALKDAGIKRKGFNNDLHKLNIERVIGRKGGRSGQERNLSKKKK